MSKIKVTWLCTPWYLSGGELIGGTLTRLTNWIRFWDWDKYEIELILGGVNSEMMVKTKKYFESLGHISVKNLGGLHPIHKWPMGGLRQLRRYLQAFAPDILHTIFIQSDIAAGLVQRDEGIPIHISSLEGALVPWFASPFKRFTYKLGYAAIRNKLSAVIALCQTTAFESVRDFGTPQNKIQVIYSGLHLKEFPFKSGWPYMERQKPPIIGTIGRLSREKIPNLLVEAAPYVLKRFPETRFVLAGSGPEKENLEGLARQRGVRDKFEFLGPIHQVALTLNGFDLFIFTSKFEGLPWTILEAQAVGVPILASAVGGVAEIIKDGLNGILLHTNDSNELANKISWLLENRDSAIAMGHAGREIIEKKFTVQREVREIQNLYEEMIDKRIISSAHDKKILYCPSENLDTYKD